MYAPGVLARSVSHPVLDPACVMKLIATKNTKDNARYDRLAFVRRDGTRCEIDMPRQGILPHDLVHYVVEDGLALGDGFLTLIAQGANALFVMEQTHDKANRDPGPGAIHAEILVEALQTQLWSGAFDPDAFAYGIEMAAVARGIAPPAAPAQGPALYAQALALNRQWSAVAPGGVLELTFPGR